MILKFKGEAVRKRSYSVMISSRYEIAGVFFTLIWLTEPAADPNNIWIDSYNIYLFDSWLEQLVRSFVWMLPCSPTDGAYRYWIQRNGNQAVPLLRKYDDGIDVLVIAKLFVYIFVETDRTRYLAQSPSMLVLEAYRLRKRA